MKIFDDVEILQKTNLQWRIHNYKAAMPKIFILV